MALTAPPKRSTHHKKRAGEHQRRSKHFMKTYWPYIPVLGIAAILVIAIGGFVMGPAGAVFGTIAVGAGTVALII